MPVSEFTGWQAEFGEEDWSAWKGDLVELHIAKPFFSAVAKLNEQQSKAVWQTIGQLQDNLEAPGLQTHRVDRAHDPDIWSARVNSDLRIIFHKKSAVILLLYAGHHEDAYGWARRRRVETNATTGAVQLVTVREAVVDIAPRQNEAEWKRRQSLFEGLSRQDLLSAGVPEDWVHDLRNAATEDDFLAIAMFLPEEAQEILLRYVTDKVWHIPELSAPADPFASADTLRNFWKAGSFEELQRVLAFPEDQWSVFLHPAQRRLIEMNFNGPARISGSAGTGKSVVALHRAFRQARDNAAGRVLLTTFSQVLADVLAQKLKILTGENTAIAARIEVMPFRAVCEELYQTAFGERPQIASEEQVRNAIEQAMRRQSKAPLDASALYGEWTDVVDAWQIEDIYDYTHLSRKGRSSPMGRRQREYAWSVFDFVREALDAEGAVTWAQAFRRAADYYQELRQKRFSHVIVDESQDLGATELRFFAAIAPATPNALFFVSDLGQRIAKPMFSWKQLGIEIGGRSHTLKVNYRTSEQIRRTSDKLLPDVLRDGDGAEERRGETVSIFSGPDPVIREFATQDEESREVAAWINSRLAEGMADSDIAVLVRSAAHLARVMAAVSASGCESVALTQAIPAIVRGGKQQGVPIGLMEEAKGFEFKAVAIMACEGTNTPDETEKDTGLGEQRLAERRLFYVGCTRAREHLLICGVSPTSVISVLR